jgi:hypothetical protein
MLPVPDASGSANAIAVLAVSLALPMVKLSVVGPPVFASSQPEI